MSESRYYVTDAADPDAPRVLAEFGGLKPGDRVRYTGPLPLPGVFVIDEFVEVPGLAVSAILDGGDYEVDADNLAPADDALR